MFSGPAYFSDKRFEDDCQQLDRQGRGLWVPCVVRTAIRSGWFPPACGSDDGGGLKATKPNQAAMAKREPRGKEARLD